MKTPNPEEWENIMNKIIDNHIHDFRADNIRKRNINSYINELYNLKRMKSEIKIITLGFTKVGKTYYLASINNLKIGTQPNFFSVQSEDYTRVDRITETYKIIAKGQDKSIDYTVNLIHTPLVLKKTVKTISKIVLTDIEGQAIEAGRNPEVAKSIIDYIGNCDGITLLIKAPSTFEEMKTGLNQLTQLFNFCGELLLKNNAAPISLVINQIDALPQAKGVQQKIDKELQKYINDELDGNVSNTTNQKKLDKKRGEVGSEILKQVLNTLEINEIVAYFKNWVREVSKDLKHQFPARIFFSSSIGFDNTIANPIDKDTLIAKDGDIRPYGTNASMLWMIYSMLRTNEKYSKELDIDNELIDKLFEDFKYLHLKGDSYWNNENELWAIRNLNSLNIIQTE